MGPFSTATAAVFVRYSTVTGRARRCGGFHYWRNTTNCYLFLVLYNIIRVFFNFFVKFHCFLIQTRRAGRINQWEMFCKKGFIFCHVSIFWTLVDLFCTKRLFSQETAFFPDYFTRGKNGRNSFSKEFSCSCAINKFRTGTFCRILNYSAGQL